MSFRGLAETGRPPLFILDALLFAAIDFPEADALELL